MAGFNLIEEPWIPVVRSDGSLDEMGFRLLLYQAAELGEIRDPLPIVELGLYRLLIALVLDIFQPRSVDGLGVLLRKKSFDRAAVDRYFEDHAGAFDLFDETRPFLQMGDMRTEEEKPLAALVPTAPSGTAPNHFHHIHQGDFAVCPAAAARLLATVAPFMTAGGAGLSPSINGAPPWYVLIERDNLFETLCVNCFVGHIETRSAGGPPWRDKRCITAGNRLSDANLMEALTWQPRRILSIPGAGGRCSLTGTESPALVRTMRFTAGAACNLSWTDPQVAYRIKGTDGPKALRPREGREIWRDTGPLALLEEKDFVSSDGEKIRFTRPLIVKQYGDLVDGRYLPKRDATGSLQRLRLAVYGMRTDMKMKVFEWQRERLQLPLEVVLESRYHIHAQRAIEQAEAVSGCLRRALRVAYPRAGAGNDKAFDSVITGAQRELWAGLEPIYFSLLQELADRLAANPEEEDAVIGKHLEDWAKSVAKEGRRVLEGALAPLDADGDALRRQVESWRYFNIHIARVFNPGEGGPKRRGGKSRAA